MDHISAAKNFYNRYKSVPGILGVEATKLLGESIVVFFDRDKIKSLPSKYKEFDITSYDVRTVLHSSKEFLLSFKDSDMNIRNNKVAYNYFIKTIKLCENLLK